MSCSPHPGSGAVRKAAILGVGEKQEQRHAGKSGASCSSHPLYPLK